MGEKGNFRSAINGFNKSDVLDYIDTLQAGYANDLRRYQQQISDLHRQVENAGKQSTEWTERVDQLQSELAELQEVNTRLLQEQQESCDADELLRLTQEVEVLRLEKKELLSRLSETETRSFSLENTEQQELQSLRERLAYADADIRQMNEQAVAMQQENQSLVLQLQDARLELSEYRSQTPDTMEMDDAVRELDDTKLRLENTIRELENTKLQMEKSSRELGEAQIRQENTYRELEEVKFRLADVSRELEETKQHLEISQAQAADTNDQLVEARAGQRTIESAAPRNDFVGDTGAFIVELYSMGQRFLELSFKRGDGCLNSMETSLSALSAQMDEALHQVKQARQDLLDHGAVAGLRLDEMVQTLEQSAGISGDEAEYSGFSKEE